MMQAKNMVPLNLLVLVACASQSDAVRSMKPTTPIYFAHQLTRRSGSSDQPVLIRHRQGDKVAKGDYIQASVTPKEAVYLYLGFCNGSEFALFPKAGSVWAEAGRETRIPPGDQGLRIGADSKSEVLYLILSKVELSLSSPDLTIKIASSGGSVDGDCAARAPDRPPRGSPPWTPTELRSDIPIEVVRYEFEHQAPTKSP
jgi:hypothetical protein